LSFKHDAKSCYDNVLKDSHPQIGWFLLESDFFVSVNNRNTVLPPGFFLKWKGQPICPSDAVSLWTGRSHQAKALEAQGDAVSLLIGRSHQAKAPEAQGDAVSLSIGRSHQAKAP
jgi:hypothetical protein